MNSNLSDSIYSNESDPYDSSETLVNFLKNLAQSIENKQLYSSQIKEISDFFLAYQFHTQSIKDNEGNECNESNNSNEYNPEIDFEHVNLDNTTNNTINSLPDFSNEDLIKFLCMGWYIYTCILREKNI